MSFFFTSSNLAKIKSLKSQYPDIKALTLPLLWLAQKQESYISEEAIATISEIVDTPYMYIYSVITFYTMFRLKKPVKPIIEVCRTLSCELNGSEEIKAYLDNNHSNKYEIIEVECMGACSGAPMCTLDGKYMENVCTSGLEELLK